MNPTVDRPRVRQGLLDFLSTISRTDARFDDLDDDLDLIDAGILDSLAMIQIITYLEQEHGVGLTARDFDPYVLGRLGGILCLIEQARR